MTMNLKEKISSKIKIFGGDLLGGFDAAIISLPQVLAFGIATGLGANAGIWGAIILCLIAGVFGTKTPLIYGITGPVAIILSSIMLSINGSVDEIITIMLLAGVIQIIIGLTALPAIVKYVPYPVISGFMNGVGTVIVLLQISSICGLHTKPTPIMNIANVIQHFQDINYQSVLLGLMTLGIIFAIPRKYSKIVPGPIIAIIVCTIISLKYNFNVERISAITFSLPTFSMPVFDFTKCINYLQYALILAIILSVESMLTLLVANSVTKTQIPPKKMLLAQGLGNMVCAMGGTTVGSAATMRSVAALKTGATTRLAAFVTPTVLILLLYKFSDAVGLIPLSVLSGILMKVGYDIIDTKIIKAIKYAPKDDLYVLFLVYVLTVFYNLIFAVGAGITLAALLYAKRIADKAHITQKSIYDKEIMEMERKVEKDFKNRIRIFHINGEFFFGSATQLISKFDEVWGTKYLILNYDSNDTLDISAIFAFEDIILRLKSQHIKLLLVINDKIKNQLKNHGIVSQIGEHHIFEDELSAVEFAKNRLRKKLG